jgi:hypothetical protein
LLHGRLLGERLLLAVQVPHLGIEGAGMAHSSVAAAMSFGSLAEACLGCRRRSLH